MISGEKIILRPPLELDQQLLAALRNDIQLQQQLLAVPRPNTEQRVQEWITRRLADESSVLFVIAERETGCGCGFLQIAQIDLLHGTGELGVCVAAAQRGQGYAREAIELAARYARDTFRLRKLTLKVLGTNERALRMYDRLGYRRIGYHERHFYAGGTYHDVVLMEKFLDHEEGRS